MTSEFKQRLSIRQISAVFYFVVGAFFIYIHMTGNTKNSNLFIGLVGWIMVSTSIGEFWFDTKRKKKIAQRFQKNFYSSDSEKIIADYFKRKNIAYEHQPSVKVDKLYLNHFNIPFSKITIEPDFYLPEFDVYVEYWGMIDDPKYKEEQYKRKKKLYEDNNLDLLSLYPKNLGNFDWDFTMKLLEIFKKRQGLEQKYR